MYYSSYDEAWLRRLTDNMQRSPDGSWCIFDNTASGAPAANTLDLQNEIPGL